MKKNVVFHTKRSVYVVVVTYLAGYMLTLIGFGAPEWAVRTPWHTWGLWQVCHDYECYFYHDSDDFYTGEASMGHYATWSLT